MARDAWWVRAVPSACSEGMPGAHRAAVAGDGCRLDAVDGEGALYERERIGKLWEDEALFRGRRRAKVQHSP
jgi:hypothetical protein